MGGIDVSKQVTDSIANLRSSLGGVTDVASAQAVLPKLRDITTQIDQVDGLIGQMTPEQKKLLAGIVSSLMPTLNQLFDKVLAIPGVSDVLKPTIDLIKAKLAMLVAKPLRSGSRGGRCHGRRKYMSIITWIILGLIAGFVGAKLVNREGQGFWLDIALGIVGALVGGFLFALFGASGVTGLNIYSMIVAIVGARRGAAALQCCNKASLGCAKRMKRKSKRQAKREENDGEFLEDTIRSVCSRRKYCKTTAELPSVALLASGALFRGSSTGPASGTGSSPTSDEGAGGLLGGLGGLLDKLQKGGLGNVVNSWIGSGQNQPVPPKQLSPALGSDIIKALAQRSGLSEEEITKQLSQVLPGVVDKLTPAAACLHWRNCLTGRDRCDRGPQQPADHQEGFGGVQKARSPQQAKTFNTSN